eukprot:CAMPEP_0119004886 /NCGR_PEP_ID=MMETSP1176-20130426/1409_1 /TAXON_ID=265551 /ORGANISM="Synedropsis recta cf, Strain CCMP1620" /LENGTH=354 /DNA_ID=CAMNT_0006956643 /DNA_START=85 /DNA_END=1149 /DNA_ORIENTATION=+
MTSKTPSNVLDAITKLDASEQAVVKDYINQLETSIAELKGEDAPADEEMSVDTSNFPPLYDPASGNDDTDKAMEFKQEAADFKSAGKWEEALEKYTAAILAAPPSALLYANRANALLQLEQHAAAERDCNEALSKNPDSAKAMRMRGKSRKALGQWEEALKDLSLAQQIDFDEGTVADLKECTEKHVEGEKLRASVKVEKEEKMKKRASEIRQAQEEAKAARSSASPSGGMPGGMGGMGGGMPGGMPGMPPGMMEALASDPELAQAMQNPKVIAAFSQLMNGPGGAAGLMSNPGKLQELMSDPEIGPVMQKLMKLFGGAAMGGGMGGMGGMAPPGGDDDDLDELPDMDEMPDLE